MVCQHGGLTFVRHNDLRDITAGLLSRVCSDVATEPPLQPLSGEVITPKSANRQDDARADIHARGFWGRRQSAFLDVRVFHPNAPSYRNYSIPSHSVYRRHELQKKREYGERVREVEQASFTPLAFSTTGGMGGEALTFYRRLTDMLLATAQHLIVALWRGFAAHCHFHCFVLLQCASGEHNPSFIVPTMLPRKWAILLALGTFSRPPFSCPAH